MVFDFSETSSLLLGSGLGCRRWLQVIRGNRSIGMRLLAELYFAPELLVGTFFRRSVDPSITIQVKLGNDLLILLLLGFHHSLLLLRLLLHRLLNLSGTRATPTTAGL